MTNSHGQKTFPFQFERPIRIELLLVAYQDAIRGGTWQKPFMKSKKVPEIRLDATLWPPYTFPCSTIGPTLLNSEGGLSC